jgi:metal-sulfur cluster biosynthetic enzyme
VVLHEVWSPPWTRAMMTEEGRSALRELGVAA